MHLNQEKPYGVGTSNNVSDEYFELKARIHHRLIDLIDLSLIETLSHDTLKSEIKVIVEKILRDDGYSMPLNSIERELLIMEIQDEVMGLGPLEPFLKDPLVSDILVNTYKKIYIEKFGKLEITDARFKDDLHLRKIIDKNRLFC